MNIFFFDTSALVKRYVDENGSEWVKDTTSVANNNPIILSHITWVEVLSAFTRLNREPLKRPFSIQRWALALRCSWICRNKSFFNDHQ